MNAQNVNVAVTVSTGQLGPGLNSAQSLFGSTMAQIRGSFASLRGETQAVMADVRGQVVDSVRAAAGSFGGLIDVLGATRIGFVAVAGAAGLLASWASVNATAKMTEDAMDLARALGTTTNEAAVLRASLEDIGAESSDFSGAAKGLARQLRDNESAVQAMGLETRDAAGRLRPMNDLVIDGIRVLNGYSEGIDRTMAGQAIFGRGIEAGSRLLLLNREAIDENRRAVQELGLETGANAVAAWREFDAAGDRAALGLRAIVKVIGDSMMPIITDLVRLFNTVVPVAIVVIRGALGGLTMAFLYLKNGVVTVWEVINAMVISVAEPIRALAEAIGRALVGDFVGAAAVLRGAPATISAAWKTAFSEIAESSKETSAKVWALFAPDSAPGSGGGAKGGKGFVKPPKEKSEKETSMMQAFEAELEQRRLLATEENALRGLSKRQEVAYWQDILLTATLSAADRLAVSRKVSQARIQVLQQEAREAQQIGAISLAQWRDAELSKVTLEEEAARQKVAMGSQTQLQLLAQELEFEQRRQDIRAAALRSQLARLDPDRDPVQIAQINLQIEAAEQQHQLRLAQIRGQITKASADEQGAIWEDLAGRTSRLWDQGVQAMLNSTLTWRGAQRAIGAELVGWFSGIVRRQVVTWAFGEQAKTGATVTGTALRWAAEAGAAARSVALWAATAVKNIMASAWEAMAGAWKAMVGIPYVGPFLAVAAAAAAFSGVSALARNVASAEGGYDIPAGVAPLTQLHEREMVLPAKHADVIRAIADGPQGVPSGARDSTIVFKGQSVGRNFFLMHRDDLVAAVKSAQRDGALS